jgi:hypothetical protein
MADERLPAEYVRPRYLILTPRQYQVGWIERRGDVQIRHPFKVVDRLADGNYVVFDPALNDGSDAIRGGQDG